MRNISVILFFLIFSTSNILSQTTLPLDIVLKRAMSAAEQYNVLVESYEADVYMRTYVETLKKNFLYKYTDKIPRFVLHDPKRDAAVIETISTLKYVYPKNYSQDIKNVTGTLTSKKDIDLIPFSLIYINVYGETSNGETFFMPVRFSTAKYYKYKLKKSFDENNYTYYVIDFTPIYDNPQLLKGTFIVENGTWRIVSFSAEGVELFSDFSFEISMGDSWLTNYLPSKFVIYQTAKYLGNTVASRHVATIKYKAANLRKLENKGQDLDLSDFYMIRLDSVPINNDTAFWAQNRTIPLQQKEIEVLENHRRFTTEALPLIQRYDSLNNKKNGQALQQFAQRMVMDTNYKYKSTEIGYSGLLNPLMIGYSSVDGITYRQKISLNFDMSHWRLLKLNAYAGYIFKRRDFYADFTSTYNYEPFHLGSVSFSAGIGSPAYSSLFINKVQENLTNSGINFGDVAVDYYKDYYLKLFNEYEIFNGFLTCVGMEYHVRKPKKKKMEFRSATVSDIVAPVEELFETKKTFAPYIRLSWTPEQYYRYERRQKIHVRSFYPTFKIEYAKSFKDVIGSTSQYDRIEADVSQNIPFGLMSSFQYHVGAGKFINQTTEYFADFTFFAYRKFPENWSDGIGGAFNVLDWHMFNSSDSYVQGHFMLETPFLLFRNIPFVSDYIKTERVYLSQLYTPQIVSYTELGYGIGNKFFNAAIFTSFHKTKLHRIGVQATFEL